VKELSEKHIAFVTALILGFIIFWLITSDAKAPVAPQTGTAADAGTNAARTHESARAMIGFTHPAPLPPED
jgi:hypothetical protein